MEIISFYLPQFHEILENNEWWGEGFTEWTNVKAAEPLFDGHVQPRVPLHHNYYDLLEKRTMQWQASIAQKAGITGFCFYHYWFKGKKLLEKPVENYLEWTDISQKYCLSWANESWIRTWSNVEGNDWNEVIDKKTKKSGPTILMKQDYGNKQDWKEHFDYLLPFFKDERYIKLNGQPIFLLYKPEKIHCLNPMIDCWNQLAKENGFSGIYFIATNSTVLPSKKIQARVLYEPSYTFSNDMPLVYTIRDKIHNVLKQKNISLLKKYDYDVIWKIIINRKKDDGVKTYRGAFIDFDDSPRRGKNGAVFVRFSLKKFACYFRKLVQLSKKENNELLFITAWNEWAEGAYLEPDMKYGYGKLKAIQRVLGEK